MSDLQYERPEGYEYDDYYDVEEIGEELASLRPAGPEGRTSWAYLGLLGGLFVVLVGFSWACNDRSTLPDPTANVAADGSIVGVEMPSAITVAVDGDLVTVRGIVPDEDTRTQLVTLVAQEYDEASLIDDLNLDANSTLEGGSIRVTGVAEADDARPGAVKDAIIARYSLNDGGTEVREPDAVMEPVDVEVRVTADSVALVGQVPDEASIQNLSDAVGALWPAAVIDPQLLTVSERTTWEAGTVRITGSMPPGDDRHLQLVDEIAVAIGDTVAVDAGAVTVDASGDVLEELEEELAQQLQLDPILFAPQSAEIDSISDEILVSVAEQLQALPAEILIEVVGHTDALGPEDENLELSQQRAEAVVERLVELGIDEARLTARGEGESSPLVEGETEEANEQNRRIEFVLISG